MAEIGVRVGGELQRHAAGGLPGPEGALEYLKRGDDRKYYSKALEKVRNETLKEYMIPSILALVGLGVAVKTVKCVRRRGGKRRREV